MSAYLKFFELERSPFDAKAQAQVVLGTRAIRDAFATVESGIAEGASRICVNGGPGMGKTSLARALPKLLGDKARVALIPDPALSWEASRTTLAKQWGIESGGLARTALVEASAARPLVLVIDQAEKADEDFLDHLDVMLSYRSESDTPVVQSVLLARLGGGADSAATRDEPCPLIWWLDRIQTLQLEFAPLPREGVQSYIHKHLKRAGWKGPELFSAEAAFAIHEYTGGVPGEISALCEIMLIEAADQDLPEIDEAFARDICEAATSPESEPEAETEPELTTTQECDLTSLHSSSSHQELDLPSDHETKLELSPEPDLSTNTEREPDQTFAEEENFAEAPSASPDITAPDESEDVDESPMIELVAEVTNPDAAQATDTGDDDPPWTLPDEFEALAMEEEIASDASDAEISKAAEEVGPETTELTSLEQALEHFGEAIGTQSSGEPSETKASADEEKESAEANVADTYADKNAEANVNRSDAASTEALMDAASEPDAAGQAAAEALEDAWADDVEADPLLAPPTPEEWADIQRGSFSHLIRPLVMAAAAVLLGVFGVAQFLSDSPETAPSDRKSDTQTAQQIPRALPPAAVATISIPDLTPSTDAGMAELVLFAPADGFVPADSASLSDDEVELEDRAVVNTESSTSKTAVAEFGRPPTNEAALEAPPEASSIPASPDLGADASR